MVPGTRLLASVLLIGCLDFDEFTVAQGGAGGGGAATGGAATGGAGPGGGGAGGIGQGGGGGSEFGPCFEGAPLQDDFDGGPALGASWLTTNVAFSGDQAVLSFDTLDPALLELNVPGRLRNCFFQVRVEGATSGVVAVQFQDLTDPTNLVGFYVNEGAPFAQLTPDVPSLPLTSPDFPAFTDGYVRIGEREGTLSIATADAPEGPWTERYATDQLPEWFIHVGELVIKGASDSGPRTAIIDDLN